MKLNARLMVVLVLSLLIYGCGGGGNTQSPATANQAPATNAGPDQSVNQQTLVNLGGSGSDGDGTVVGYSWNQLSGTTVVLTNANSAAASFTVPDIIADETLSFRLTVTDNDGAIASDSVDILVSVNIIISPIAPTGLSAMPTSASSINLSWTDTSSDETSFVVQRSTTSSSGFATITTLGANTTSYADATGLSASTTYYYQVYATNSVGDSGFSNESSATTSPPPVPIAPTGLSAMPTSASSINLSWTDTSSDETSFVVQRSTTSSSGFATITTLGANTTSYADATGLSASTTYYYQVYATNSVGDSGFSNEASATTLSVFTIGGTLNDLVGSITLLNNGTDALTLNSVGGFSFIIPLNDGASYNVSVQTQPIGQTCSVTNGSGTVSSSNVNNVTINCVNSFTVGGMVSGLTGSLSIQNNAGNSLSISANGVYVFTQTLTSNEIYNVQINQNPIGQICSITNATGQITNADITNADILCTVDSITVSLSGSYQAAPLIHVDSDINDPLAEPNISNDTLATSQSIPNFSTVHGFLSFAGTGRTGDRFENTADVIDQYNVVLQQNQVLRLTIANFAVGGIFQGDLDLLLMDAVGTLVAVSNTVDELEMITVPVDGEYNIVVQAVSGSTKYTLSLDNALAGNALSAQSLDFVPGEAVVQLKSGALVSSLESKNQSMNFSHGDKSRAARAKFSVSASPLAFALNFQQPSFEQRLAQRSPVSYEKLKTLQEIKRLNLRSDVEFAEPNYIYHAQLVPDDTFYTRQWHYPAVNLPQAWDITTGSRAGSDVIVAVIDSGVFLSHPEFAGQLVSGYDFIRNTTMSKDGDGIDSDPDDPGDGIELGSSTWHGTHVAGTVAALSNNSSGVTGVAWGAKIMPLRALGLLGGSNYDILQCVRFAAGLSNDSGTVPPQKADVINLSLAGEAFSQSAQNDFNAVRAEGVIVVAAAGNGNTSQLWYPASYDGVVSVSATDFGNNRAPYSNFGSRIDVAAPGGNLGADLNNDNELDGIFSTLVDTSSGTRMPSQNYSHGTSMASPHVAGIVALMRAVHPLLSPDDFDNLLISGAITTDLGVVGRDDIYGHGLIDALKAVQQAQLLANGGSTQFPAIIVATPNQFTMGASSSASLVLSNEGGDSTSVAGVNSDASWLSIAGVNLDSNGLGDYQIQINRSGLVDSTYVGNLTFILATGSSLNVQVTMVVGVTNTASNIGKIYVRLLDANNSNSIVDEVIAVDQGNGVFDYTFNNVGFGSYRIIGGSDIDNDDLICLPGEVCGGYPTFNTLGTIEVINSDVNGLDFTIVTQEN